VLKQQAARGEGLQFVERREKIKGDKLDRSYLASGIDDSHDWSSARPLAPSLTKRREL